MKKLTIEQKAQRYDEVIERAKTEKEKSRNLGLLEFIDENFPELSESEDERIRKALINGFKDYKGWDEEWFDGITVREAIDWLEKQGKQNLNAWTEGDEKQARQIERIVHNDGCSKKLQEQIANWFKSIKYRVQPQPQQEWNEEDTQYINDTLALLSFGCSIHSVGEVKEWLQSLNNRVQLKQEWNEEDERNASYICAALDCYYRLREDKNNTNGQEDLDKARNWLYNKLKSLSPQNKWKPSGWSEKDETAIHLACEFIRHHSRKGDSIGGIDCSALIERLKFLKDRMK
ncbi:MAG: hypothetical protein SPL06_02980 [Bacteroidales bacterium]|nr:hypothetical protein [Bacteroidales bacterium]